MNYKKYVEVVNLQGTVEEESIEPSESPESYNTSFTVIPTHYLTHFPTHYSTNSSFKNINDVKKNDNYGDTILVVICSSVVSALLILFLLWHKYNRRKSNKLQKKSIYKESKYSKSSSLDTEFGTPFVLDNV